MFSLTAFATGQFCRIVSKDYIFGYFAKTRACFRLDMLSGWEMMVPKAGFEPARVTPPPPQDGASAKFRHLGTRSMKAGLA